ncbi:MAG TPA: DUF3592 domain-containing protein [Terriglobales bacterium]
MNELGPLQPNDFRAGYQSQTDEELLQLWVERSDLLPDAEIALQNEIARRGLTRDAATAKDRRVEEDDLDSESGKKLKHRLAPPVSAWGPSIAWFWLREVRLQHRTRNGIPLQATVESTKLTRATTGRGGGGRRAEIRFSYDYQGPRTGRTIRDFVWGDKVGKALAFDHKAGDTIAVLVDPNDPDCSYYPSGFGWIQPLLYGAFFAVVGLLLFASFVAQLIGFVMKQVK